MKIKDIFKNFNKWQDILLVVNTIILIILVSVSLCILNQQKYLTLQITSLTNKTIPAEQNDYKIFPLDELLTIEFDKEKMIQAYEDSIHACENHPQEGSGSLYICQEEYFEANQNSLYDAYNKISSFCQKNAIQASRVECIEDVLEALKDNKTVVELDKEIILDD